MSGCGGAAGSALAAGAAARGVRGEVPGAAEGRRAAGGDRDGGGRVCDGPAAVLVLPPLGGCHGERSRS